MAATLAVATAAFPEVHAEAAFPGVASRVEVDTVVGGVERLTGWTGGGGKAEILKG